MAAQAAQPNWLRFVPLASVVVFALSALLYQNALNTSLSVRLGNVEKDQDTVAKDLKDIRDGLTDISDDLAVIKDRLNIRAGGPPPALGTTIQGISQP